MYIYAVTIVTFSSWLSHRKVLFAFPKRNSPCGMSRLCGHKRQAVTPSVLCTRLKRLSSCSKPSSYPELTRNVHNPFQVHAANIDGDALDFKTAGAIEASSAGRVLDGATDRPPDTEFTYPQVRFRALSPFEVLFLTMSWSSRPILPSCDRLAVTSARIGKRRKRREI